jgi:hypothetical protein
MIYASCHCVSLRDAANVEDGVPMSERFFARLCQVTGDDPERAVDCLVEIACPLGLTEDEAWDAVDELLSEGLIRSALQSGVHVRLTERGMRRWIEYQRRGVD